MPAAWIGAGAAVIGAYNSSQNKSGSQGASGGGSGSNYTPTGLGAADKGWQQSYAQQGNIANQNYNTAAPQYQNSLNQENSINYQPYQQAANQAGSQYQNLSNTAQQQMGQYGQQANLAGQQQQSLYSGANQIMNQAFDPNNAQFNQSQQQLSDQVNSGQAMRGLGNSPVGGQEYNNAMSNFDIGWNTQKLQNEQIGLQGASQASNAGGSQGQLVGADMVGALNAGQQGAGYQLQAGQTPIQAQQMIAGMPAQNASAYEGNMNNLATGYSNASSSAIPYMNAGIGAQQANTAYNTQQNAANMNLLTQGAQGLSNSYNTPGSWLNNAFNGNTQAQNEQQVNTAYGNTTDSTGQNTNPYASNYGSAYVSQ